MSTESPSNIPHAAHDTRPKNTSATVVVADRRPLSLLATAGVLHYAGMRCVCARTTEAVRIACGIREKDDRDVAAKAVEDNTSESEFLSTTVDLIVWDVGDEAPEVLQCLESIREVQPDLPAILLAESRWAGLEKKTEALSAPTRCLFKPIDPSALIAVAEPLLWMPALQTNHRRRGSRPNRPGWVMLP